MKSVWIFLVVMIVACTSAKVQDYCGDGVVGEHEECEISDTKPCENNSKLVTCSRYCTWNYSNCSDNCGDGIIQEQDGEECDGSELGETTCATLGYSRGLPACGSDCKFDTSTCEDAGSCGDGIFQPDWEECDSVLPVECADLGYFTGTATCNEDCTVDNSACNHVYQWGCSSSNILFSNTVDSEGNLIVVGITQCGFDGQDSYGDNDGVVVKFDKYGNKLWTRVIGTIAREYFVGVATDSNRNIYVTGYSYGSLYENNAGVMDTVLLKLDPEGEFVWGRQYGTDGEDTGLSVIVDSNDNIFVGGNSQKNFIGNQTHGSIDYFILKLDTDGNIVDSVLDGGPGNDFLYSLKKDNEDNIYIAGHTNFSLFGFENNGSFDIHISKYSNQLDRISSYVFGTSEADYSIDIAVNDNQEVFLLGYTSGNLETQLSSGGNDALVLKLDSSFNLVNSKLIGSAGDDEQFLFGNRLSCYNNKLYGVLNIQGPMESSEYYGDRDVVLAVLNEELEIEALKFWGNELENKAQGFSVFGGRYFITGSTLGAFEGYSTAGFIDYLVISGEIY